MTANVNKILAQSMKAMLNFFGPDKRAVLWVPSWLHAPLDKPPVEAGKNADLFNIKISVNNNTQKKQTDGRREGMGAKNVALSKNR